MNDVRRLRPALSLVFGLSLVFALPGSAGARSVDANSDRLLWSGQASDYVIVQLRDQPLATYDGRVRGYARTKPAPGQRLNVWSHAARAYSGYLAGKRASYRNYLRTYAPTARIAREYRVALNALAVKRNGASIAALARGPNVLRVTPSWRYWPTMNRSTDLINAPALWSLLPGGQTMAGAGIKVAIIDSGIDLTNHFLSDAGYPDVPEIDACPRSNNTRNTSNKVVVCRVYASGVAPGASAPRLLKVSDHGTHVAGTVAGRPNTTGIVEHTDVAISGLSGVAPRALLGDYNVFPGFGAGYIAFGGSAFSHDIAAALEDAVADGMHVANMSLGGFVQGPHDVLAEASNAVVEAGMIVVVAAGNSGPNAFTVQSPGSAANVITAGASTNPHFLGIPVTVSNVGTFRAAIGSFNPFDPPIVGAQFAVATPANGCTAISGVSGKIAIIDRGVCTFTVKVRNAQAAGALGVIVVNNVAGDPTAMATDETPNQPRIPAAMVSKADGPAIKAAAGKQTMTANGTSPAEVVTDNEDIIAGFSSTGPVPFTYIIKPDVTAPGVNVLSSVFNDRFAFFNGTSMAAPHVAGSAALLRQFRPTWSAAQIKSALVNTAKRPVYDHVNGTQPTGVLTRGGGRIDLAAARATSATLFPSSISFGYWSGNAFVNSVRRVTITNVSGAAKTFSLVVEGSPAGLVSVSPSSVTLANGASATVTVTLVGGKAATLASGRYEGDLVVRNGGVTLRAPWFALVNRQGKP
jgi:minor extracellular serine protease Vpr